MQALFFALYFISGFCVLAMELMWIHAFSTRLGNSVISATLVMSAFFLFAGLGNLIGSRLIGRFRRPLRLYGACEIGFAASAMALFPLQEQVYALVRRGGETAAEPIVLATHGLFVALMIGLPSMFSGCSFPALIEGFVRQVEQRTRTGGAFYGGNLFGAAIGTICGGILLPHWLGYTAGFYVTGGLALLAGLAAILAARKSIAPSPPATKKKPARDIETGLSPATGLAVLIASGLLTLALEILTLQQLRQLAENSIYIITAGLFAFIVNLGLGSLLAARFRPRADLLRPRLAQTLWASGVLVMIYPWLFHGLLRAKTGEGKSFLEPFNWLAVLLTSLLLMPMLIAAGMVFPSAWELVQRTRRSHGASFGVMMFSNKAGAAFGVGVAPFVLVPLLGLSGAQTLVGLIYVGLSLAVWQRQKKSGLVPAMLVSLIIAGVWAAYRPVPAGLHSGEKLLDLYQGPSGIVSVTEGKEGSRHIVLNQSYLLNGTGRALLSQQHQSWIPLFLSPAPERVVCVGMGSGISAAAALDFPVQQLVVAELVADVQRAAREHFAEWNKPLFTDPRARILTEDGRFVLQSSEQPVDVIICDLFFPAQEGAASLYSRDFFAVGRERLTPRGIFCLWLPGYLLDEEMGGIIIRTFLEEFPNAIAVRGNFDPTQNIFALLGSKEPFDLSDEFLRSRLNEPAIGSVREKSPFLRSEPNTRLLLLGDLVAVKDQFRQYPISTDDCPIMAFVGPQPIPHGKRLRGYTFLEWFGRRFLDTGFPSCQLGDTDRGELLAGIQAGNYYFAASIASVQISDQLDVVLRRDRQMVDYLTQAKRHSPESDIRSEELGR